MGAGICDQLSSPFYACFKTKPYSAQVKADCNHKGFRKLTRMNLDCRNKTNTVELSEAINSIHH